jgi:hypothetical protein
MIEPFQLLERQSWIAPMGVKFWDVSTGGHVGSGLRVTAYPGAHRLQATQAFPNRSGAYVLHRAWGMRQFELGVGGGPFPETVPPRQLYTIVVNDDERRFLPVRFEADLPTVGLFKWTITGERTPLDPPDGSVPLYPSTLRTAPAGMAVLRAELHEALDEVINGQRVTKPAGWTMLEARFNGRLLGRGIADEQGRIALFFTYPPPQDPLSSGSGSPLGSSATRIPLLNQQWTLQLQAFYQPAPVEPRRDELSIPKLNDIFAQSPANLFLDEAETQPLTEVILRYGPAVFVPPASTSPNSPLNPTPLSILFVSPTG